MHAQGAGEGDDSRPEEPEDFSVEEALEESFPASDPPSWTRGRDDEDKKE